MKAAEPLRRDGAVYLAGYVVGTDRINYLVGYFTGPETLIVGALMRAARRSRVSRTSDECESYVLFGLRSVMSSVSIGGDGGVIRR